jgi:hypothetical protein
VHGLTAAILWPKKIGSRRDRTQGPVEITGANFDEY